MIRLTMILLCLLLAAAAAGRYKAEVAVRETRMQISKLDQEKAAELAQIQLLRAEIAYLESPDRLAEIADRMTDLKPLAGSQMMTAEDFRIAFGETEAIEDLREATARPTSAKRVTVAELGGVSAQ